MVGRRGKREPKPNPLHATEPGLLLPCDGLDPAERLLNGLITNDKFCLTRPGQLRLSWPRARGGLRGPGRPQLPGEVTRRGEEHAAAAATHLARSAHRRADRDRPAALGSGLPAPPAVGDDPARAV